MQNKKPQITGVLKDAVWCIQPKACIHGKVFDDIRHRFNDGTPIWTSTVLEDLGDGLYRTRNSIYLVEFRNQEDRPHDLPVATRGEA